MSVPNRYIIVITEALKDTVNTWIKANADTVGGDQTFTVGLSATGTAPATHYWCGWRLPDSYRAAVINYGTLLAPNAFIYDESLWTAEEVLTDLGLQRIDDTI